MTSLVALLAMIAVALPASAFRVSGVPGSWTRWDAAPRFVGGVERSLVGGLRYSLETGSYASFRDQFMWVPGPPSDEDFEAAVERAFENWTVLDPATGLHAGFYFVSDLATVPVDDPGNPNNPMSYIGLNRGAEIDVFADTPHPGPGFAASVVFFVDSTEDDLTLSSGTTAYPGFAISGADIRINPAFVWSLRGFEILLSHEIGHALGLGDLEGPTGIDAGSGFIDNDYDPSTTETAVATLTDSFSLQIDPLDPDASALSSYVGNINQDPGLDSEGVQLLMESQGFLDLLPILGQAPLLQNDEFAGRQFLYPVVVPEPGLGAMVGFGLAALIARARIRRGRDEREGPI